MTDLPPLPQSFTILSRLQSGTEEVVPLDMVRAYGAACAAAEREKCAQWLETQRNDVPATGAEFAAALRARGEALTQPTPATP